MNVRAHIIVKGRVQGVGFRFYTLYKARSLGLVGTVRNLVNGDVKVIVEGEKSTILALIKELRIGPMHATVKDVVVNFEEFQNEFASFQII
ncbi:acylphosphatase [candidate division KSB1 bacterium]|nr:acylphosphatase [candidate division KSB1 bacterium]RQW00486.1 MAG: acylphosphatase [candidate division KSB1 bacterium]